MKQGKAVVIGVVAVIVVVVLWTAKEAASITQ